MLARHGHTSANAAKIIDTVPPGADLTDTGRAEAKALAVELGTPDSGVRKAAGGPVVDIVHSGAHRARDTARIIGGELGMPVREVGGIHEIFGGDLEGLGGDEVMEAYRSVMRRWYDGDLHAAMPGAGESGAQVLTRYRAALDHALHAAADLPDGPLLVVSHSAAIRFVAFTLAGNLDADFVRANPPTNCATIVLVPDGEESGDGSAGGSRNGSAGGSASGSRNGSAGLSAGGSRNGSGAGWRGGWRCTKWDRHEFR